MIITVTMIKTEVDLDRVSSESAAVSEVNRWRRQWRPRPVPGLRLRHCSRHGRDLDVILAPPRTLDVQLKVEYREADRLLRLDSDSPATLGVHVVLVRIVGTGQQQQQQLLLLLVVVGTGQVASAVEFDGWRLACGRRRQRRTATVNRHNYINTRACADATGENNYIQFVHVHHSLKSLCTYTRCKTEIVLDV